MQYRQALILMGILLIISGCISRAETTNCKRKSSDECTAEAAALYEQRASQWVAQFKTYPDKARDDAIQGDGMLLIRIDRHGNIVHYELNKSTGSVLLDTAIIDMVKRANPLPAVPDTFPAGELIDLLIPVNFHLK